MSNGATTVIRRTLMFSLIFSAALAIVVRIYIYAVGRDAMASAIARIDFWLWVLSLVLSSLAIWMRYRATYPSSKSADSHILPRAKFFVRTGVGLLILSIIWLVSAVSAGANATGMQAYITYGVYVLLAGTGAILILHRWLKKLSSFAHGMLHRKATPIDTNE